MLFHRFVHSNPYIADSIQFPVRHMLPLHRYEIRVVASRTYQFPGGLNAENIVRTAEAKVKVDVKEGDPPQLSFR